MKKRYRILGVIMIGLGLIMLYVSIADIEIRPIIKIMLGGMEILVGIIMLGTTLKRK